MQTIATTDGAHVEIISSYAATNQSIVADPAPTWTTIGAFWLPVDCTAKIEAIGHVSLAGVALKVRLYDVAEDEAVSGTETADIDGIVDERQLSGAVLLTGKTLYQFQALVTGDAAESGIVRSAQLVN